MREDAVMPISGQGWELHIVREKEQRRASNGRRRTVGRYQVFHNGVAQTGKGLKGATAEAKGPGANKPAGNGKRIEQGRYPLATQEPGHYATWNYAESKSVSAGPKPGLELKDTVQRAEILIHPGKNAFLSSIGCINPCASLPNANEIIEYEGSRERVIAIIEDLKAFLGADFPKKNGKKIPKAFVVIDGEPAA
jgi:hypothetical protein